MPQKAAPTEVSPVAALYCWVVGLSAEDACDTRRVMEGSASVVKTRREKEVVDGPLEVCGG